MESHGGKERKVFRVALEAHPLRTVPQLPPCSISAVAVRKQPDSASQGGEFLLYIGTDKGQLLLFSWKEKVSVPIASTNSYGFRSSTYASGQRRSPSLLVPNGTTASSCVEIDGLDNQDAIVGSNTTAVSKNRYDADKLPYDNSREPSPASSLASSYQDIRSLEEDNLNLSPARHTAGQVEDFNSSEPALNLLLQKTLGNGPINMICLLSQVDLVSALSEGEVIILDLNSLCLIQKLPMTKGTSAMTCGIAAEGFFSSMEEKRLSEMQVVTAKTHVQKKKSSWTWNKGELANVHRLSKPGTQTESSNVTDKLGSLIEKPGALGEFSSFSLGEPANGSSQYTKSLESEGSMQLAVAVKNRILLFDIRQHKVFEKRDHTGDNIFKYTINVTEVFGVDGIRTMAWLGSSIFVGTDMEYLHFSLVDGQVTKLFSFEQSVAWRPILKSFPNEQEVLLLVENIGIISNNEGQPSAGSLVFEYSPDGIGQMTPYVIVGKEGRLEVFHYRTGEKIQSFSFGSSHKEICLITDDKDSPVVAGANFSKVFCLVQVSLEDQIRELLKQKEFDEAITLAKESALEEVEEHSIRRLAMVHAEAGFMLLFDLRFKEAIDHLLQSALVEPTELFLFFPSLTSRWRTLIPRKRYWGLHPPPQAIHLVIDNGVHARQNGLLSSGYSPLVPNSPNSSLSIRTLQFNNYLSLAIGSFIRYWKIVRKRDLKPAVKEAVDTVLVLLHIQLGASEELEELVVNNNGCLLEEVESALRSSGQLRALAFLYEARSLWTSALEIWQYLACGAIDGSLVASSSNSSQVAAAAEAARVLEQSCESNLVLQHVEWILKLDHSLAFDILTSTKRAEALAPEKVLHLLASSGAEIRQRYLQWLVEDQGSEDPHYHTELALSLVESVLRGISNHDAERQKLQFFLQASDKYDVEAILHLIINKKLWREEAILQMRKGDETAALQILALKLGDIDAAEKYCCKLGRSDAYLKLLSIYLKSDQREPMYAAATHLLLCYGTLLDPLKVLEVLSSNMPLDVACKMLAHIIKNHVHSHRQGQIVHNLSRSINLEAHLASLRETLRYVQVTSETACVFCRARIGTKFFALYPDESVSCYKCFRLHGGPNDSPVNLS